MTTGNGGSGAPVITGANVMLNNGLFTVPMNPFDGITITDPNGNAVETVTISLADLSSPSTPTDANGFLSLSLSIPGVTLTETSVGTYTLAAGSPAAITQALDAIQFTPVANPAEPGLTVTELNLSVSNGTATANAEDIVLAGAPVITGTVSGQLAPEDAPVNPFSNVTVTDSPGVTNMDVFIQVRDAVTPGTTDADGMLSLQGSVPGITLDEVAPGIYSFSAGSPAEITQVLHDIVFTPAFTPSGQTVTTDFQLSVSDGLSTSNDYTTSVIATDPPCFYQGTRILTERGEVPVDDLVAGDRILTVAGAILPVKWVGHRKVAARFSDATQAWPIRIKANAFAENVPSRDLLLSPDHAVFLDGILAQAGALVNGISVVREKAVPEIFTYYHVELDDHALIFAENVPSETFIDNVSRVAFDNWDAHKACNSTTIEMPYPRAKALRQVPRATREWLAERGVSLPGEPIASAA